MESILAIDDDPDVRRFYEDVGEYTGHPIDTADTGESGLALVEKKSYSLIFLDLRLPGIDGVETLRAIRKRLPETPVYIVSSFYDEYFERLSELSGEGISFEFLRKPFRIQEIVSVIQAVLGV
ncbi:MAG: response regulator [Eubacteriales bacterium]|nr:response regulator [Eubacteriales bacterium]MDD3082168.1 response regulator [Desulfobacterales bacterium]MDD3951325.1 response regulator [Desulfobacterales bacterium]